jgi:geranylgeranyl diphosphate synthase type II
MKSEAARRPRTAKPHNKQATRARAPSSASEPPLLEQARRLVEPALAEALERAGRPERADGHADGHAIPPRLLEAMRYAVFSPGKRLRPALVLGAARAVGGRAEDALPAACAVELVHAYSLVHDDLPALDDDDERRGQPSCHIKFDEATALLAGDALLTEALTLIADGRPLGKGRRVVPSRRMQAALELGRAVGAAGMVGGQVDDLAADMAGGASASRREVLRIHRRKTGRLIQASAAIGALFGGGTRAQVDALRAFGEQVGLAFQLVDDVLDGDGLARVEGADAARAEAEALTRAALAALAPLGRAAQPLVAIAEAMAARTA